MGTVNSTWGRWRPVDVGFGLIVGAGIAAVLWSLTALLVVGPTGYEACEARSGRVPGQQIRASVQWFPLKSLCTTASGTLSLTAPVVTVLWTIGAVLLAAAAATGVAVLVYATVRWLRAWRRR